MRHRSSSSAWAATRTMQAASGRRSSPGKRRVPTSQSVSRLTVTVRCSMRPWGSHDGAPLAQTRDRTLVLLNHPDGLGFSARLDPDRGVSHAVARAIASDAVAECSVNFTAWNAREDEGARRIAWGQIDHIALVATGTAAYPATACWCADTPINNRSPHVREVSQRWAEARRAALSVGHAPASHASAHCPSLRGGKPVCPPSVVAVLARADLVVPRFDPAAMRIWEDRR